MKRVSFFFAAVGLALVLTQNALAQPQVVMGPVFNPQTGNDYYLLEPSSWTNAQAKAISLGGNLATINDQNENNWVCQTFGSAIAGLQGIWIGLNDMVQEGVYRWVSGESVVYTNWEINQPDNMENKEDYVHMWTSFEPSRQTGRWNDIQNDAYIMNSGVVEIELAITLVDLTIEGPSEVAENSIMPYKAIAHFDDGSIHEVTSSASWSVAPNDHASIDAAGNLTTNNLEKFQNITITAQYDSKGITIQSNKTVTVFAICNTGYALQFDGENDYVNAGSIPALKVNQSFTWSLWVKVENQGSILGNRLNFTHGSQFIRLSQGGFEYYNFGKDGVILYSVPINKWVHLAIVKNGSRLTYYSNGEIVGNSFVSRDMPSVPLYFGADPFNPYGPSEAATCTIDEVSLWNIARTQNEIRESMNFRLQGNEAGLLAYWNFDEGAGQVVHDLSPNGNNGQLGSTAGDDTSDPQWVASDAPVGVCTPYLIAVQNIKTALAKKLQMLDMLKSALENEQNAIDALRDMITDGDLGDLKKTDVFKSMADIRLAMVQQQVSRLAIRRSVVRLEEALSRLGVDVPPHQWPDTPDEFQSHNPADINMDGQINLLDLSILIENWNQSD